MGNRLFKPMPIINHRYFKSQAFYFKKFNFLNPRSSIIETTPSDRRGPSQCLLASLIQSTEGPFPPGSPVLVWKGPPLIDRLQSSFLIESFPFFLSEGKDSGQWILTSFPSRLEVFLPPPEGDSKCDRCQRCS